MNTYIRNITFIFLFISISSGTYALGDDSIRIKIANDSSGLSEMSWLINGFRRNYVDPDSIIGHMNIIYRDSKGQIDSASTRNAKIIKTVNGSGNVEILCQIKVFQILISFKVADDAIVWKSTIKNISSEELEIIDLYFPLPIGKFNNQLSVPENLYTHSSVTGHSSFVYWVPYSGRGDILVMNMVDNTSLEFFENRNENSFYFIHTSTKIDTLNDTWRIPASTLRMNSHQAKTYGFRFELVKKLQDIRDVLYEQGGLDVKIIPGMTLPNDLYASCALRTKIKIKSITAEHAKATKINRVRSLSNGYILYTIAFSKLGENMITVHYGKNKKAYLNFFSTEPLETMIKKRSDFITYKQQIRDSSKWYNGLYSIWDMEQQKLLSPDDKGNLPAFVVGGSDDPSNCKPLYVSEKNVLYPDKDEINRLEYYEKYFVWGGLQRRDDEYPYPYGIYGSENWFENRSGEVAGYNSGGWGKERMWRTFDYVTHLAIYYNLYKIARDNPSMMTYLDAKGYLERAYRTAMAYFEVPYNIEMGEKWSFHGWTDWAYKQGNFHERYIIYIIEELKNNSQYEKAELLRREWEKKVKYFIYDDPWPFASEFEVDRTAFESTYYVAEYAKENVLKPQEQLWYDKNKKKWYSHLNISDSATDVFMQNQLNANLALRGVIEPSFNQLGTAWSDNYGLDYMSQMGGVAILDYALKFSTDPSTYINIGYNSLLSSWALMNTGNALSNYGYWYPGKVNDGAVGWVFTPWQNSTMYFRNIPSKRGIWKYDGEIDHGLVGAIHGSSSIVINDPIFGWAGYGCQINDIQMNRFSIVPKDGVRRKLNIILNDKRFALELLQDGFLKDSAIKYDVQGGVRFTIENRQNIEHTCNVLLKNMGEGIYDIYCGNKIIQMLRVTENSNNYHIKLPIINTQETIEIRKR